MHTRRASIVYKKEEEGKREKKEGGEGRGALWGVNSNSNND